MRFHLAARSSLRFLPLPMLLAAPVVVALGTACGGNTPQPTPPIASLPTPPKGGGDQGPAVDLSAVAIPDSMFIWGRANRPARSLDMLSSWVGQNIQGQGPLREMIGEKLAHLADLDQPVDFAVYVKPGMNPRPSFVLSVAVKGTVDSVQPQLADRYTFVKGQNGVVELARKAKAPRPEDADDDDDDGDYDYSELGRCALAPAFGSAPARVVCAREGNVRDAAVPFLTRTVTRQSFTADLHAEARQEAFKEFLTKNRGMAGVIGGHVFGRDAEIKEAVTAFVEDVFDLGLDAQRGVLDVNVDDKTANGDARITLQRKQSAIARALVSHPDKADAPPALFGKLPGDSAMGFYVHGFDATDLAQPKVHATKAIDNLLQKRSELDAGDRKAFVDAFTHLADLFTAPMVYGRGVDVVAASQALNAWQQKKTDPTKEMNALALTAGWDAIGIEAPIAKVQVPLKEIWAAFNRAHVQTWMKNEAGTGTPPGKFNTAGPIKDLPAGHVHLELVDFHDDPNFAPTPPPPPPGAKPTGARPPAPKPAILASKLQIVLVPDGDRTWMLTGMDIPTIVAKAKAILAGTDPLSKRTDLEVLRTAKSNAGGFVSLRGVGMLLPLAWATRTPGYALDDDPLFGMTSSSSGMVAVPFWFSEQGPSTDASQGALTLSVRIPRAEVADFLSVHLFR